MNGRHRCLLTIADSRAHEMEGVRWNDLDSPFLECDVSTSGTMLRKKW